MKNNDDKTLIKEKENIMKNKDNTKFKKIEEIKVEQNQEGNNKERKSKTCSEFFFKDPNDYTKELMKNNIYNYNKFLKLYKIL